MPDALPDQRAFVEHETTIRQLEGEVERLRGDLGAEISDRMLDAQRLREERDRLRAENERLRKAFCDEAYILMVQALDVKALPKGRKRILTEQAIRMARVGLGEGDPRHVSYMPGSLDDRARDVIAALAPDEQQTNLASRPASGEDQPPRG